MNILPESGFLRLKQIIGDRKRGIPALIPVSASTWWAGVRSGRFPSPIRLGRRLTLWSVEDIRAYMAKLVQAIADADTEVTTRARAGRRRRRCINC